MKGVELCVKQKIYITALHLSHGGIERAIVSLANAFGRRDYPVEILCSYHFNKVPYTLDEKVQLRYLSEDVPNKKAFLLAKKQKKIFTLIKEGIKALLILKRKRSHMIKVLRQINNGVIIATRHEHAMLLSKYGQKNVNKIVQLHEHFDITKKIEKDFQKRYRHINTLVTLTKEKQEEIAAILPENSNIHCITIPNFLPEIVEVQPIEKSNQCIAIGRLSAEKGFERLLSIWEKVSEKHPDISLLLVGDGEEKEILEQQAEELYIREKVVFTGFLPYEELMIEIAKSKLLLVTSYYESFSLTILEAMQMGCIPIAFDVPVGPRYLITNNEDGYLIKDNDIEKYIQVVTNVLQDEEKYKLMVTSAKAKAEQFSEQKVMQKWQLLLEESDRGNLCIQK